MSDTFATLQRSAFAAMISAIVLVAAGCASPQSGARYQYSQLHRLQRVSLPDVVTWYTGSESLAAASFYELFQRLGGERDERKFMIVHLFDVLGAKGWALVHYDRGADTTLFYFQRRAR